MIGSLLAAFVSGEAGLMADRAKRAAIAYLLALVFVLLGLSFLVVAGYIQLARLYGSLEAALGLGGGFLLIGLVIAGVHVIRARAEQKRIAEKRKADIASLGATAAIAAIPSLIRGRGKAAGAAVAVAPLVLGVAYALYQRRRDADETDL